LRVLCFQVEVCATGWSIVHRSPTEYCVSETTSKTQLWGGQA